MSATQAPATGSEARCAACGAAYEPGELYCEECGAETSAAPGAVAAAGTASAGAALDGAGAPDGAVAALDGAGASAGVAGTAAPGRAAVAAGPPMAGPTAASGAGEPDATTPRSSGRQGAQWVTPDLFTRPTACLVCGGPADQDGYCGQCGSPVPNPRDSWTEQPASWLAGMSDRGRRHPRNEDAMALAASADPGFAVMVVCDGVSSSSNSHLASLAAARAARDALAAPDPALPDADPAGPAGPTDPGSGVTNAPGTTSAGTGSTGTDPAALEAVRELDARVRAIGDRVLEASRTALTEVINAAGDPPAPNPPSCTLVAAVLDGPLVVVGGVGDSRAYWLPDGGEPRQLTIDDSWATEQIAAGVPREQAERGPRAHAITRWLGADAPDATPRRSWAMLDRPGWLLVCSDGLWNYCSPATDLQALLAGVVAKAGPDPGRVSAALVAWANAEGGHDNITVALARVPGLPAGAPGASGAAVPASRDADQERDR